MRVFALLLLSALCMSHAARASADASAIVLGLRSIEGDDDVANSITAQLRSAARGVAGWDVIDRSVTMTQMSLAHSCDDVDAACLSEIASGLGVTRVLFGTLRRTSARSEFDYQVSLSIFDADTGSIGNTETMTFSRAKTEDPAWVAQRCELLVQRLAASESGGGGGSLSIQIDVPTAEVRLDGQLVGQTQDRLLVIDNVEPGEHTLEIAAVGYGTYSKRVNVSATSQTSIIAALGRAGERDENDQLTAQPSSAFAASDESDEPREERSSLRWLGYTLLGVSAASLVGMGASWLVIDNINGDATYRKYRDATDMNPAVTDVCDEADSGKPYTLTPSEFSDVRDMCARGATFEVLQWVFLGTAVASGGVGAFILLDEAHRDQSEAAAKGKRSLALQPKVSPSSFSMEATLRF
jgi:hypothetical protein